MIQFLSAVLLYVAVFGIDYLFYVKQGTRYEYISHRTYALFVFAQIFTVWLYFPIFKPFIANAALEVTLLGSFLVFVYGFTLALVGHRVKVCSMSSRTLRCLTPYYVLIKGAEIVFQQMIYLVIAVSLASLLGVHFFTYIGYILILLIVHVIVILGGGQSVIKTLIFGLAAISVPIFYVYTELQVFWPAVYLHSLMYVFYWLMVADFDGEPISVEKVDN